jgi:hypothetical protein
MLHHCCGSKALLYRVKQQTSVVQRQANFRPLHAMRQEAACNVLALF